MQEPATQDHTDSPATPAPSVLAPGESAVDITSHVAIVGLPGVGKSSIGRRAAEQMGCGFVDLDDAISDADGRSVTQIFADDGEPAFRDLESATLRAVLSGEIPIVIATGGGIVVRPTNRDDLRDQAKVVWLRASPETLLPRISRNENRPLLADGDPATKLRRLLDERTQLYGDIADEVLDVDDLTIEQVVCCVVELTKTRS